MPLLTEVHGLTEDIKNKVRALVGPCPGFGVDEDGLLYVYQLNTKSMRRERLAEGWNWQDIIEDISRQCFDESGKDQRRD